MWVSLTIKLGRLLKSVYATNRVSLLPGYSIHFNSKNKLATFLVPFVSLHGLVCSAVGIVHNITADLKKTFSLLPRSETTEQTGIANVP
jgi:hypothetical protein